LARHTEKWITPGVFQGTYTKKQDYEIYFSGSESNAFLQPGAQKKYFFPLYSLVNLAVFSSTVILQIGSIAIGSPPYNSLFSPWDKNFPERHSTKKL